MKNKQYLFFIIFIIILLTGCGVSGETHSRSVEVTDIKSIYINHGSTDLLLKSDDQQNLEASYNKRGITLDKSDEQITLGVKKRWFNIGFDLNMNEKFVVTIPDDFSGKLVINGSSGDISSDQLSTSNLDIETKSGNISLAFVDFHSDVHVDSTSGNVGLILNKEQPDVQLKSKTVSGSNMIAIPSLNEEGISGNGNYEINIETISGDISVK